MIIYLPGMKRFDTWMIWEWAPTVADSDLIIQTTAKAPTALLISDGARSYKELGLVVDE